MKTYEGVTVVFLVISVLYFGEWVIGKFNSQPQMCTVQYETSEGVFVSKNRHCTEEELKTLNSKG